MFYPFSIKVNKRCDNCNNINDPYAKICVADNVEILNVGVFNLMSKNNETRHRKWDKTCKLDNIICNSKQRWKKINVDVNAQN